MKFSVTLGIVIAQLVFLLCSSVFAYSEYHEDRFGNEARYKFDDSTGIIEEIWDFTTSVSEFGVTLQDIANSEIASALFDSLMKCYVGEMGLQNPEGLFESAKPCGEGYRRF
jgi:hypothetical protein